MAIEVIAQDRRPQGAVLTATGLEPALGGIEFAVLFRRAILGVDKLRWEGDYGVLARFHDHRGQHRMEIGDVAIGVGAG